MKGLQALTLIGAGVVYSVMGLLFNLFAADLYYPSSLYLSVSLPVFLVGLAMLIQPSRQYLLQDLATFCYLFLYLGLVYLSFQNGFHPHLLLVLITAHILFAINLKSFLDFVLFGVSSVLLLALSVYLSGGPYVNSYLLTSSFTLITLVTGIHVWFKESKQKDLRRSQALFSLLVDAGKEGVFVADGQLEDIVYRNQALSHIVPQSRTCGLMDLLDKLGLNKNYLNYRFKEKDNQQEICNCQIKNEDEVGKQLEILIRKLHVGAEIFLVFTIREINQAAGEEMGGRNGVVQFLRKSNLNLKIEKVDLRALIYLILDQVKSGTVDSNIQFRVEAELRQNFYSDIQLLIFILQHLIKVYLHRLGRPERELSVYISAREENNEQLYICIGKYPSAFIQTEILQDDFLALVAQSNGYSNQLYQAKYALGILEGKIYTYTPDNDTDKSIVIQLPQRIKHYNKEESVNKT